MKVSRFNMKSAISVYTFEYSYLDDFLKNRNLAVKIIETPPEKIYGEEYFLSPYADVTDRWHFEAEIYHKDGTVTLYCDTVGCGDHLRGFGSSPKAALINLLRRLEGHNLLVTSKEDEWSTIEVGKFHEARHLGDFLWDLIRGKRRKVQLEGV